MSNNIEKSAYFEKSCTTENTLNQSDGNDTSVPGAVLVGSLIITQALEKFERGQRKDYDSLVQKIGDPALKTVHLQRYLQALKRCVSLLNKKYDILVGTVLRTNWANFDEETADEFIEFLIALLSAQTFYLKACLRMLVKLFLPNIPTGVAPQDFNIKEYEHVFNHAHNGLHAILEVVPTMPKFLLPMLSDHFPYIKKHKVYQTSYIKNLLHITQYLPLLRQEILEDVVNHISKIDVEVPRHELDDPEEEEVTQFEVDLEGKKDEPAPVEDQTNVSTTMNMEMAESLDALMEMLFIYIRDLCHVDGKFCVDSSTELFYLLMNVFDKIILPTHASCHIHFIIFYVCSLDQAFSNSFLDSCWKKIENPSVPAIIRQASSSYMASFVARANYLPTSIVKLCMELLVHWIQCYIDDYDANCLGPDVSKYGPFYSICQALFYMFVFRHRSLLELEDGHKFVRRLNFERIITSRLNPLKVCLPTIVNLFADVTSRHQIVLCYTVIERNKRSLLPMASVQSNKAVSRLTVFNQLDSFFPFDPYLLRRSSKFIKPLYQEWEGVEEDTGELIRDELDEKAKESDSEDEDEEYMEYGKTPDIDIPDLTPDTAMCISPGFAASPPLKNHDYRLRGSKHRLAKHKS